MIFLCERAKTHAPTLCISVEPWQQEGEMPLPVEEWVEGAVVTPSLHDYACVFVRTCVSLHCASMFLYCFCCLWFIGSSEPELLTQLALGGH